MSNSSNSLKLESNDKVSVFSDTCMITASDEVVSLDFAKRFAMTEQNQVVSRIVITKNHAKALINELQKVINMAEGQLTTNSVIKN